MPLGVNTDLFKPGPRHGNRGRVIAIASADTPLKGVRTLLHAVARLRTSRDLELRLVAKVEPNGPTHKLIAELGISDIVHITSGLSDAELAALFASAEVACIPSLYEGFSLPAVEAMASGTPIVASRVGALPEVLGTDGACAELVPPADVDALTRALGELLDSPEKRRSLGKAGRARAINVFSWEAVAAQTVRVYERAIARKAAAERSRNADSRFRPARHRAVAPRSSTWAAGPAGMRSKRTGAVPTSSPSTAMSPNCGRWTPSCVRWPRPVRRRRRRRRRWSSVTR